MKACITIRDDVFIKTCDPASMRLEVAKTIRAHEIGKASGLFRVPKVFDYNESTGKATFELIPDTTKLRNALTSESVSKPLIEMAARALAAIHRDLTLPDNLTVPLPAEYNLSGTEVFIHGDFGLGNVCVSSDERHLVIFDWQATRKLGLEATYGSRYFDVMWFVYNLFYRPIGRPRYQMAAPAAPMAREFLRTYFEASNCDCDVERFKEYAARFMTTKLAARGGWRHLKRRLLLIPSHIKLRKFIHEFR